MITLAQLLMTLICIIGKTKLVLHQALLIKLMILSRILKKHLSICNINTKYKGISKFSFRPVSVEEFKKIVRDLKTNKAVAGEIPTKILKECELTFHVLTRYVNKSIETGHFPDSLKLANVAPVFKNLITS